MALRPGVARLDSLAEARYQSELVLLSQELGLTGSAVILFAYAGPIPVKLSYLKCLTRLELDGNQLTGEGVGK